MLRTEDYEWELSDSVEWIDPYFSLGEEIDRETDVEVKALEALKEGLKRLPKKVLIEVVVDWKNKFQYQLKEAHLLHFRLRKEENKAYEERVVSSNRLATAENEIRRLQELLKKLTEKVSFDTSEVRIKMRRKEGDSLAEAEAYSFVIC